MGIVLFEKQLPAPRRCLPVCQRWIYLGRPQRVFLRWSLYLVRTDPTRGKPACSNRNAWMYVLLGNTCLFHGHVAYSFVVIEQFHLWQKKQSIFGHCSHRALMIIGGKVSKLVEKGLDNVDQRINPFETNSDSPVDNQSYKICKFVASICRSISNLKNWIFLG